MIVKIFNVMKKRKTEKKQARRTTQPIDNAGSAALANSNAPDSYTHTRAVPFVGYDRSTTPHLDELHIRRPPSQGFILRSNPATRPAPRGGELCDH